MAKSMMGRFRPVQGVLVLVACVAFLLGGCARRPAPTPENQRVYPVALGNAKVMLLPVQGSAGVDREALDSELAYWLKELGPRVRWIPPADLQAALDRSPGLEVNLRDLPVERFFQAQVKRIGDPLFGELRRLAALVDAPLGLVPVGVARRTSPDGQERVEITATVIDVTDGDVVWFAVIAGEPEAPGGTSQLGSAARALARALIPGARG